MNGLSANVRYVDTFGNLIRIPYLKAKDAPNVKNDEAIRIAHIAPNKTQV